MRIAVLQDYLRCGGTEGQSIFLSRYFQKANHEVHLITFRPGGALRPRLNGSGVKHTVLQPFDTHLGIFAPRLTRTIAEWRPDVLLCMGRAANIYGGYLQSRLPGVAVVGSARSGRAIPGMELRSLKRMRAVLTNSEWWRQQLINLGLNGSALEVVHNALIRDWDGRDREGARAATRRRLNAASSTVVLLNVAAFRRGKRHDLLLELASKLGTEVDWQLWLVGEGPRWRATRRLARKLHIEDRVRFLGFCDDPFDYYAGADIAVSVSVNDALPNFIVEAHAMGLPAVATDIRGVCEVVQDGVTGALIGPDAHDEFLQHLRAFIKSPKLRLTTGNRAAEFAKERFAREPQARAFLDTLFELHLSGRVRSQHAVH